MQGTKRLQDEFGPDEGALATAEQVARPQEHKALFHGTNTNDHFRFGVRVTRGTVRPGCSAASGARLPGITLTRIRGCKLWHVHVPCARNVRMGRTISDMSSEERQLGSWQGRCAPPLQVKLFTDFYQSDVIVASPLGVATRLADARGDGADFLAGVEVALVLRADVMQMQNWAHVETVFAHLNTMPKQQHGTDIMRVRCGVCRRCCRGGRGPGRG